MSRKKMLWGVCLTLFILSLLAFIYFFVAKPITPNMQQLGQLPVLTPQITEIPKLEDFLILPNGYQILPEDIESISTHEIKNIFIDKATDDYTTTIKALLPSLVVYSSTQTDKYTFCDFSNLATSSLSANGSYISSRTEVFSMCSTSNKTSNIYMTSCMLTEITCQQQYLIALNSDTFYYNTNYPLLALTKAPSLSVDIPYGTTIITWINEKPIQLAQTSYSIEILNKSNKRIYATGKISGQNTGDFFSPMTILNQQPLTVKLRVWFSFKGITFKYPHITLKTFEYTPIPPVDSLLTGNVQQMSWIPDWGMSSGITSVKADPNKWSTISPVWYTPNKSGTLNKEPSTNSSTLLKLLRSNKIKVIPTISLFDADILKEILNKNRTKHVNEIVHMVTSNNYDGVDLDYESTYQDDKELLLQFLTELSAQLHSRGKLLSFTALPKIDDRAIYGFLPQTHQAQDWKAIGAVVDEFRIMAYDFTGQGSLQPGPLSPIAWNESLIRYAIAQMPPEKVVLALPLYAHGWPKPKASNLAGINNDKSLSSGELKNTISPQHDDIAYIKSHSTYYRSKYDPVVKEVRAEFKYKGSERVMYYLDKTAINERIKLAQKYGIKGVCYWRIGGERID